MVKEKNITDMPEKQTDGFDAIEYPLDFPFKVICETQLSDDDLLAALQARIHTQFANMQIKSSHTNHSKKGRYIAVTLTVHLSNRQELEGVYSLLLADPNVKMTL